MWQIYLSKYIYIYIHISAFWHWIKYELHHPQENIYDNSDDDTNGADDANKDTKYDIDDTDQVLLEAIIGYKKDDKLWLKLTSTLS